MLHDVENVLLTRHRKRSIIFLTTISTHFITIKCLGYERIIIEILMLKYK